MAINKNHEFEELNGVKCAIVEKNASQERVDFLQSLLEFNNYTVIVVASPPPKGAAPAAAATAATTATATTAATANTSEAAPAPPPAPVTFTVGVTDVTFNAINAVFGRSLKTRDGRIVTLAYWQQKEAVSHDEVPYFKNK
jgi:hypothetical protein